MLLFSASRYKEVNGEEGVQTFAFSSDIKLKT